MKDGSGGPSRGVVVVKEEADLMKLLEIFGCEMPSTLVPSPESRVVNQKAIKRVARTQLPLFMNTGSFRNRWLLCCSRNSAPKVQASEYLFCGVRPCLQPRWVHEE